MRLKEDESDMPSPFFPPQHTPPPSPPFFLSLHVRVELATGSKQRANAALAPFSLSLLIPFLSLPSPPAQHRFLFCAEERETMGSVVNRLPIVLSSFFFFR